MNLTKDDPENYHRVLEISTRKIRDGEVQGFDYDFKTDEEYDLIVDELFEKVEYQFSPNRYGAEYKQLSKTKWNVIVVSIEGFISAMKNVKPGDNAILLNILLDTNCDVYREGRDPLNEQKINLAIIHNFLNGNQIVINEKRCSYSEILLSKLKKIRENKQLYLSAIDDIVKTNIKSSLGDQLKSAETYEDLISVFMSNSSYISNSITLLDILEIECKRFRKSVKELCDDSLKIVKNLIR